ncbi:C40 family peptidase [Paenibacillus albicereus]|uniref:C40 family peptidase n=1 Tax=Paenibacillus albicereus TaxID=2726185 RepID=A0A6H2GTZ3_9BACL|nr:C40 family peptidase [Paenibacillus albicereus]QJC50880.1 C40 family peptidase [Paenibacillus albicereus]
MRRLIQTGTALALFTAAGAGAAAPAGASLPSSSDSLYADAAAARVLAGMAGAGTPSPLSAEADAPLSERGTPPALGGAIADYALDYVGASYQYGGASPAGFDASGFLQYIYRFSAAEVQLPRTIAAQYGSGAAVGGQSLLLPGDAVFFRSGDSIAFAGIYIGNKEFVSATVDGVKRSSLASAYWQERYAGARRMTESHPVAGSGGSGTGSGSGTSSGAGTSSGSGSGSSNGLAGPDQTRDAMRETAYFASVSRFLDKAKPVLDASLFNRLEEKAELAFRHYEQGLYLEMLAAQEEIVDEVDALPADARSRIGIKSSELYGSSIPAGLYSVSTEGELSLKKESGYAVTLSQRAAAEQLWKQVRAAYPKAYLALVKELRLDVHRGGMSRVETLAKGSVRLVLDPSDLTPGALQKTRWALARELGKLVTQQGPGGSQLDHFGGASSALAGTGGLLGGAFAGPASGSSQWLYARKDSLLTAYYGKFWPTEVASAARAGKPMTTLYTKLFFRDASAYQAQEDIADAWAAFLLYDKPAKPADRRDEKMLFFYAKPELTAVRDQFRSGVGLSKSYPKTTTFADLIGPRTW